MKTLAVLTFLAVLPAGLAIADGRDHRHGDDCSVPMADWQPREAVEALAAENGWTVRRIKVDDGCYEIVGTDGRGARIAVKVDPATLAIIEVDHEDGGSRHRERDRD